VRSEQELACKEGPLICLRVLPGHLLEALRKTTGDCCQQMRICDLLHASKNHRLLLQIFQWQLTNETQTELSLTC
jgi:hypothetical protein